jgi:transcription elongation factor Elf1
MSENENVHGGDEIQDTDIIFDCPNCGKSLAIDYHGAGLNIPCTDCGKLVEVPIPEGMEIADIDSNQEEQTIVVLNLRKSLAEAADKIQHLTDEVHELNSRREALEKIRTDQIYRFGAIVEKTGVIQKSMDDIAEAIRKIADICKQDTR